jgi:hypothetical protein
MKGGLIVSSTIRGFVGESLIDQFNFKECAACV